MGRPRRRAVNLLPEGLRAWDGVSRHQQFHPDLFAQRRRPEHGGAAAQSHAAGTWSQSRFRADLRRPLTFTIDGVAHPTGLNATASVNENVAANPTQVILHPQATDPISTHLTYEAENLAGIRGQRHGPWHPCAEPGRVVHLRAKCGFLRDRHDPLHREGRPVPHERRFHHHGHHQSRGRGGGGRQFGGDRRSPRQRHKSQ